MDHPITPAGKNLTAEDAEERRGKPEKGRTWDAEGATIARRPNDSPFCLSSASSAVRFFLARVIFSLLEEVIW
jgi:hypothetical protein